MDILSNILNPIRATPGSRTVVEQGAAWPNIKAVHGKYYVSTDRHGDRIVSQTLETWEQLGTIIEQQRLTMKAQDSAIKNQSDEIRRLMRKLDDTTERLEILRHSHRAVLKDRVEAQLGPEPIEHSTLSIFNTPKVS
jgi:hypothetical protein